MTTDHQTKVCILHDCTDRVSKQSWRTRSNAPGPGPCCYHSDGEVHIHVKSAFRPWNVRSVRYTGIFGLQKRNPIGEFGSLRFFCLTHWGRMTRMCDKSWVNIAVDNGLVTNGRQAIIKNNVDITFETSGNLFQSNIKSKMRIFHRFMIIWKCRLLFPAKFSRPRRVNSFP